MNIVKVSLPNSYSEKFDVNGINYGLVIRQDLDAILDTMRNMGNYQSYSGLHAKHLSDRIEDSVNEFLASR